MFQHDGMTPTGRQDDAGIGETSAVDATLDAIGAADGPDDEVPSTADFHRRHAKMLDAVTASIEELGQLAQRQPDRQREATERMLAPVVKRLRDALELD
jgi:hypothetical protein